MSRNVTPLQRLLPRRSWTEPHGLGLIAWTVFSGLMAVLFLVTLVLLVDLLTVRGSVATEWIQQGITENVIPEGATHDSGLWVQAARFHNSPLWSWLPALCRQFPALGTSAGAASVLVFMLLLWAVAIYLARTQGRIHSAKAARQSATWLRSAIHRQTLRLGPSDLTGQRHLAALKHFVDDAEIVRESLANWRWRFIRAVIFLPILVISILAIDLRLGLQCLVPVIACWFVYRYERQLGNQKRLTSDAHAETEVRFLAEALKQTRLVRGYNMEEFEQNLFNRRLERMTREASTGRRGERIIQSTARCVTWIGICMVILLVSLRVISSAEPLPVAFGFAMLTALCWVAVELASLEKMESLKRSLEINGDRIYRYLDEIPEVGQAVGAKFIQPVSKSITLESVHYQQMGHQILRGIDLKIEARTEVALVSLDPLLPKTVAYLLPRFIEPGKGRVLFDGEDIAWGTLESIRTEAIYVGADDPALSGTIRENILCGDPHHSLNDAIEAAKQVHAHKFITHLPQGYDTVLGQHGLELNAGEIFRLSLARAILRNPAILIIEEPAVLLDDDTKNLIDDAYQRIAANRTVIYLPHRLSTIRGCDRVIMLHDGVVECTGTHSELSKQSELYRHWDYLTFNTFSRRSRRLQKS